MNEPKLPKVLVAAPTYSGKHYIFPTWYKLITNLTYKNYDWLVVDNSRGRSYLTKLRRAGYKKITHLQRGEHARYALAYSSEYIRQYAIENDYDYIMMIETDLLPPADIIERLLKHDKSMIGAVYEIGLHNSKNAPRRMCLYDYANNSANEKELIRLMDINEGYDFIMDGKVKSCAGMGLGCVLINKKIFSKYNFKYTNEHFLQSDVIYYLDLAQNKQPVWVDTSIRVPHYNQNWINVKDR